MSRKLAAKIKEKTMDPQQESLSLGKRLDPAWAFPMGNEMDTGTEPIVSIQRNAHTADAVNASARSTIFI